MGDTYLSPTMLRKTQGSSKLESVTAKSDWNLIRYHCSITKIHHNIVARAQSRAISMYKPANNQLLLFVLLAG
jgi:hypothetical protein